MPCEIKRYLQWLYHEFTHDGERILDWHKSVRQIKFVPLFTLFLVSSTCRSPVGPLFVSRLVLLRDFPKIRRSVHCPSRASTGSSHCPSYRDSATPRPLVPSVAQLLTQLDTSVRWEDVPISSTGSSFNTHPFVLLLTLISPLSYGGRETVFEPFERSNKAKAVG